MLCGITIMAGKEKKKKPHSRGGEDLLHNAVRDYDIRGADLESILQGMTRSGGFESRNLADGIALTEKALLTSFERHQIAKVTPEIGDKFDHNRHQAMFEAHEHVLDGGEGAQGFLDALRAESADQPVDLELDGARGSDRRQRQQRRRQQGLDGFHAGILRS